MVVDVVRPDRGDGLPALDAIDGLVVLGGSMGATDDERHGWLAPTRDLIATAVDAGLPVLGVCLGHQMLAAACGGRVARNPRGKQQGVLPVGLTDDGRGDALLGRLRATHAGRDPVSLQWNDDVVVELPPGAALLAETADGVPQALRIGDAAWGVQFHPEVDPPIVRTWAEEHGPVTPEDEAALAHMVAARDDLERTGRTIAEGFVDEIRHRRSPRYIDIASQ